MHKQVWTLKAKIKGSFFLVDQANIKSQNPPHPSIIKMRIDPEFNKNNKQTGEFKIHS